MLSRLRSKLPTDRSLAILTINRITSLMNVKALYTLQYAISFTASEVSSVIRNSDC